MTNSQQTKEKRNPALEADKRIFAAKYFDGYEIQSVPKKNGRGWRTVRVYVGDTYEPAGGRARLNAAKLRYAAWILVFFGCMLFGGAWRSPVNSSPLVVLPYSVALIAGLFALIGIGRLLCTRERMTRYSYNRYCREVGYGAPTACAGGLLAAAASLFMLIRDCLIAGAGAPIDYLIPMVSFVLCAAAAYAIRAQHERTQFTEIKGREPFATVEE